MKGESRVPRYIYTAFVSILALQFSVAPATASVDDGFLPQPVPAAAVAKFEIKEYEAAFREGQAALAVCESSMRWAGDCFEHLDFLVVAALSANRPVDAEAYARRALVMIQRIGGPRHARTAVCHYHVGQALFNQGRTAEAIDAWQAARAAANASTPDGEEFVRIVDMAIMHARNKGS
jgi:tetratricopeptide (TPR) repeat protein